MKAVVCFGAACGLCSVLACLWAGLVILNDINETVSDETWGSMMAIKTLRDNGENYNYARSIFGRQKRSNAECTCGPPRGNCPQGLLKQYRYQLKILILSILCDNGIDGTPGKPGLPGEDIPIEEDFPKGCIKCPPGPVGEKGRPGEAGLPGTPGDKGKGGLPGEVGAQGLPGVRGLVDLERIARLAKESQEDQEGKFSDSVPGLIDAILCVAPEESQEHLETMELLERKDQMEKLDTMASTAQLAKQAHKVRANGPDAEYCTCPNRSAARRKRRRRL
ncbi:hypothetical protein WR25_18342 [Diploscapter pachys]|uniref:Nematode cuticle collagen N-terminal domain-containing protein n=1 Tax=Diploscapter pachys TaxID=2018661 RepID=A0A2A2LXI7_9BILA|nr:hypothetical protein WR25_18342 [Diploscapter pachys]